MQADDEATTPALHTVEVQWPAKSREVLSKPQNPVDSLSLANGTHTFSLFIEGVEHQISVNVNNDTQRDTQEEFLARLARAIDQVDSRISADLEYSYEDAYDPAIRSQPMNRMVRLRVTSTEQGRGTDYYFSDREDGDLVRTYGLDSAPPARSASVRIMGQLRRQETNQLSLDDGHVTGEIKDTTVGPVQVDVSRGPGVITSEINQIIVKYNELVSYLNLNADVLRPSLKDRVVRPLEQDAKLFDSIGLRATTQGRLKVSSGFNEQIEGNFGAVRQVLLDENSWTQNLFVKLDQIIGMDIHDFAASLTPMSVVEERRRAREFLENITEGIISGYV